VRTTSRGSANIRLYYRCESICFFVEGGEKSADSIRSHIETHSSTRERTNVRTLDLEIKIIVPY